MTGAIGRVAGAGVQLISPAASRTAASMSLGLTSSSLATCSSAFRPALSTACSIVLSPTTTCAAAPSSMTSPNSLTSARDMPRHRCPLSPPTAAPTAAVPMIEGGNKTPSSAPTAAPLPAPDSAFLNRAAFTHLTSLRWSRLTTAAAGGDQRRAVWVMWSPARRHRRDGTGVQPHRHLGDQAVGQAADDDRGGGVPLHRRVGDRPRDQHLEVDPHWGLVCDHFACFLTTHSWAAWLACSVDSPTSGVASKMRSGFLSRPVWRSRSARWGSRPLR